jgi:hypothetical protein
MLPTDIIMSGNATIFGPGKVTLNDSIWAEYEISSPMNIFVDSIPPYESEIDTLKEFEKNVKDAIRERFQEASIQLDVVNGLPLGAKLLLVFATDTTDFFSTDTTDTTKLVISNIKFDGAPIGADGYVVDINSLKQQPININLSEREIKMFAKDYLLMGSKIFFPGTNKRVKFRSIDALNIYSVLRLKVLMKND